MIDWQHRGKGLACRCDGRCVRVAEFRAFAYHGQGIADVAGGRQCVRVLPCAVAFGSLSPSEPSLMQVPGWSNERLGYHRVIYLC